MDDDGWMIIDDNDSQSLHLSIQTTGPSTEEEKILNLKTSTCQYELDQALLTPDNECSINIVEPKQIPNYLKDGMTAVLVENSKELEEVHKILLEQSDNQTDIIVHDPASSVEEHKSPKKLGK